MQHHDWRLSDVDCCRVLTTLAIVAWTALPAAAQETSAIVFDRQMTVGTGASLMAAAGETIARVEDRFVPDRLFTERGVTRRTANVAYRFSKLMFFDLPQEAWLVVVNHEVMGHGARLRERFDGDIRYRIDAPAPYGPGGGSTSFSFNRPPSRAERLAISAAGMEADAVAARAVAERAFSARRLHWRAAIRYLGFELDTLSYVSSTADALETESPGHDVAQFVRTYNDAASAAGAATLTSKTLRREVIASLANPMIGVAAFAIGRYIWSGASDTAVPSIAVGNVRFLPIVRYQLTPYGREWSVTNHLSGSGWPSRIDVRIGRAPGTQPWGIGIERRNVATVRKWRLDFGGDIWRQPNVANRVATVQGPLETGVHLRLRAERPVMPMGFGAGQLTAIVDIGVKTAGFVPGYALAAGPSVRVGIGIPIR